ncbi:MAG: glycosyltransferase family A protein [Caldimonas sp.]
MRAVATSVDARMWESLPAPDPGLRAVVVVPARNEAAHLPMSLAALARQVDASGKPLDRTSFEVVVFANNCDDESASSARRFADRHPELRLHVVEATLAPPQANIGFVRRQLMDEAARRLESIARHDGAILSTDADTRVAPDWLAATWAELDKGADAVGGRILTDASVHPSASALRIRRIDAAHALLRSRLASLLDPEPFDPWPRHHQHFGASLAVTARAYRLAGGVPDVPYLEDDALVRALERAGMRVRRSPHVRVVTSSRLDGRAAVGLSWQLRQWAEAPPDHSGPLVESPLRYARALSVRAVLRQAWTGAGRRLHPRRLAADLDARLGVASGTVERAALAAETFGALWQDLDRRRVSESVEPEAQIAMSEALVVLRVLIRHQQGDKAQSASKTSIRYCG